MGCNCYGILIVFGSNLPFFVQLMLLFCWHHKKVPLIGQLSF